MMIYLKTFFIKEKNINESLEMKVESLRKAGLNVSVISKNDKYKNGYILGKMNDKRLVSYI